MKRSLAVFFTDVRCLSVKYWDANIKRLVGKLFKDGDYFCLRQANRRICLRRIRDKDKLSVSIMAYCFLPILSNHFSSSLCPIFRRTAFEHQFVPFCHVKHVLLPNKRRYFGNMLITSKLHEPIKQMLYLLKIGRSSFVRLERVKFYKYHSSVPEDDILWNSCLECMPRLFKTI